MTERGRTGTLEIEEDMRFQKRVWAFQRAGWLVMALVIVAGLLGALGGRGPLSSGEVGDEADVRLEYPRLSRHGSREKLVVTLGPGTAAADSTATVWFGRDYLDGLDVRGVTPEPLEVLATSDRITYRFKLSDPGRAATVSFAVEPLESFARQGELGGSGASTYRFSQFVFP